MLPPGVLYRHRQLGTVVLCTLGIGATLIVLLLLVVSDATGRVVGGTVLAILLLALILFATLRVEVRADEVLVAFGPGWIRRRIRIEEIRDVRAVRNRWYYGWGIRLIPRGWMFNVSGFDAVELELNNGRVFRIGTDQPQELAAAIQQVVGETRRASGL